MPDGFVRAPDPRPLVARFRVREPGIYGEVPYVEEWKPLPPRLHASTEVDRPAPRGPFAIGVREVTDASGAPLTGLTLDEARAHAAAAGARLPTEDEWQLAAEAGLLERVEPLVWNWTESEHSDGRTRFAILKGGCAWKAEGSDWYADGGPQDPDFSFELLLTGPLERSSQIGFRLRGRPMSALDGIRVLETATLFAAPLAGMFLGDFGAEVIKIEHPTPARSGPRPRPGARTARASGSRRWPATSGSITLDLSEPGRPRRLPRARRRAPTSCSRTSVRAPSSGGVPARTSSGRGNPRLVVARVTGFGQTGPYASRPGFGTLAEAMSGFAALNGEPGGPPLLPPLALADGVTALATAFSIMVGAPRPRARPAAARSSTPR